MSDIALNVAVAASLEDMSARAIELSESNDFINSGTIISEWSLPSGECLLTNYLSESLENIKDDLLYVHIEEDGIGYGTFSFVGEVQLPTDNI